MTYKIIIARYNESLEWTKQFSNVIIYNKGEKLEECYNEIKLENVGREGHTYYKYIYDNYDNLADYTIFLQGNPFDHSPNIIKNLEKNIINKDLQNDFKFLSKTKLFCKLSGCSHHNGLPLIDVYEKIFDTKLTDKKKNKSFRFGAGGQFIVSKNQILKRPKEFYLKIIEILQNNIDPIEGYVIERFHSLIFR
jgi:hypothetical protein